MTTPTIRILSFNCWGLKYVAKNRKERINAISEQLAASNYDIIGLQELWVFSDFQLMRSRLSKKLPYIKLFYSGALGAGLALFSRYPILWTSIHPYSLNGSPLDVTGGDWFVGKAAASILIDHPTLGEVEVFNTHLYARGGEDGPEECRAHRLVNTWELSKLIRQSAELGRYVIAMGDYNNIPSALPIVLLREHACLIDAWEASHPRPRAVTSIRDTPSPEQALRDYGVTADSPLNTYSAAKPLGAVARRHQGKRIDYIFFRHPLRRSRTTPTGPPYVLKCSESNVVMTGRVPGYGFSYSDHFGVEATIEVLPADDNEHDVEAALPSAATTLSENCISDTTLVTALQALTANYRISRNTSHFQLTIFLTCIIIALVLIVSSAFLPRSWINPIFVLFTVFVSWLGTTMLYSGFIYGRWELNALKTIIDELELWKQQQDQSGRRDATNGRRNALLDGDV